MGYGANRRSPGPSTRDPAIAALLWPSAIRANTSPLLTCTAFSCLFSGEGGITLEQEERSLLGSHFLEESLE